MNGYDDHSDNVTIPAWSVQTETVEKTRESNPKKNCGTCSIYPILVFGCPLLGQLKRV